MPPAPRAAARWQIGRHWHRDSEVHRRTAEGGAGGFPPRTHIFCALPKRKSEISWPLTSGRDGMRVSVVRGGNPQHRPGRLHSFGGSPTIPVMVDHHTTTEQKALELNLDRAKYGTIAEIGAGQEVAGWLFHVGGAAGTIAKTISAYDMAVSDALYGPTKRYVSRERLESMLAREFDLLVQTLGS